MARGEQTEGLLFQGWGTGYGTGRTAALEAATWEQTIPQGHALENVKHMHSYGCLSYSCADVDEWEVPISRRTVHSGAQRQRLMEASGYGHTC